MNYPLFISCPKGLEYLLEEEMKALGLHISQVNPQGVFGEASITVLYQICIWSRLANRVQLILFSGEAHNEQSLNQLCRQFPWQTVFSADKTLAIEFHGSSDHIRNTMYGAQLVKDAVVDHFRELQGERPSVDKNRPEVLLHAHLKKEELTLSLDLMGYSMHQRGYRTEAGLAPLKENLAAAMLLRARWPQLAEAGYALYDPFCGSGTLVIEAAMMAAHIAPGLLRTDQNLIHWASHQNGLWEKLRSQALEQVKPLALKLYGSDMDATTIAKALSNAKRAGVAALVEFEVKNLQDCKAPAEKGLVIANPPYGERLGEAMELMPLYQSFGQVMHQGFPGWEAAFLCPNPMLSKATGLRASKQYALFNGAIACKLYCLSLEGNQLKNSQGQLSENAQMFANRLRKNFTHLQKWAKRNQISCYRVYDADLPEYAYAIDIYNDYAVLQEYAAPASIPAHKAEQRSLEVMQISPEILGIAPGNLVLKQRKQQKGSSQYEKLNQSKQDLVVTEGAAQFKVNLYDYLDTGLFLDHRKLRLEFAKLKPSSRFLNLFCYTGSASVHAALAGAITTNVDMSNTYLLWAEENFKLNRLDLNKHQFIRFDCLKWLQVCRDRFDVIFLDPPSFSNSKKMEKTLDIQRDQEELVFSAMKLLADDGLLYFSTNYRQFKLSAEIEKRFEVKNISEETLDDDFKRDKKIHHCFIIKQRHLPAE